jgi:hypothetical protein
MELPAISQRKEHSFENLYYRPTDFFLSFFPFYSSGGKECCAASHPESESSTESSGRLVAIYFYFDFFLPLGRFILFFLPRLYLSISLGSPAIKETKTSLQVVPLLVRPEETSKLFQKRARRDQIGSENLFEVISCLTLGFCVVSSRCLKIKSHV